MIYCNHKESEKMMKIGEDTLLISAVGMRAGAVKGKEAWVKAAKNTHTPTAAEKKMWAESFKPFEQDWLKRASKSNPKVAPLVLKRWKEMAASCWRRQAALDDALKWGK